MSKPRSKLSDRLNNDISVSLSVPTYAWVRDHFWGSNKGGAYVLTMIAEMYPQTLDRDIKGYFTMRELLLMIDTMKSVSEFPKNMSTGRFFMDQVKYQIEDNRYAIKWQVGQDELERKLYHISFSPFSMMCLAIWAWTGSQTAIERDEYVKELL